MTPKTPGGQAASEKFQKRDAAAKGLGAENADGHTTEAKAPGEAPVASDSGSTNVGVRAAQSNPGEKGISGMPVDPQPEGNTQNMK